MMKSRAKAFMKPSSTEQSVSCSGKQRYVDGAHTQDWEVSTDYESDQITLTSQRQYFLGTGSWNTYIIFKSSTHECCTKN